MTSRRNTIQKDLVRNTVYEMRRHVTANEVYEFVKEFCPTIGKGTVYRNLDILVEEGNLRKVEVSDGPNRFDLTLKNHYHVRCVNYGEISDVDMDEILTPTGMDREEMTYHDVVVIDLDANVIEAETAQRRGLLEKIHDTHGTDFLGYDILFKGICPKCQKKIKDGQIY